MSVNKGQYLLATERVAYQFHDTKGVSEGPFEAIACILTARISNAPYPRSVSSLLRRGSVYSYDCESFDAIAPNTALQQSHVRHPAKLAGDIVVMHSVPSSLTILCI